MHSIPIYLLSLTPDDTGMALKSTYIFTTTVACQMIITSSIISYNSQTKCVLDGKSIDLSTGIVRKIKIVKVLKILGDF